MTISPRSSIRFDAESIVNALIVAGATPEMLGSFSWHPRVANQVVEIMKYYHKDMHVIAQIERAGKIFGIETSHALEYAKALPEISDEAEAWSVTPKFSAIGETYEIASRKVVDMTTGMEWFDGDSGTGCAEGFLRQSGEKAKILNELYDSQKGDIVIFPAQFGLRLRGFTAICARNCFKENEFGLGVFELVANNLINPGRFGANANFRIMLMGDEFGSNHRKEYCLDFPGVRIGEKGLNLTFLESHVHGNNYAVPTGFLP